jgi:hypothetical protein
MPVIYALGLFVLLIVILSTLRARLVYELSGTSLLIFGTTRPGIMFYSVFFLPGTIIHELSHWIVAEILQVRTGEITIFPDFAEEGESRRLGSVATQRSDPFRGFLIGIAPFIIGLGILVVLGKLFADGWGVNLLWWQLALIIYGIIVIANSMMISKEDRRTWPFIIVLFLFLGILIFKYYPSLITGNNSFFSAILLPLDGILGVTVAINLVMIGGSYGLRRLIEKLTKRRIL